MYVYKVTNKVNGMLYIGITICSLAKRWREHKCAAKAGLDTPLYNAMRKYGLEAFEMVLVHEGTTRKEIQEKEKELIAQHNAYVRNGGGYNLTLGGEGYGKIVRKVGEESYKAVLTEELVAFIRSPELWDKSNRELVDMVEEAFGRQINIDTLKSARQGKGWRHLNDKHPPIIVKKGSRKAPMSEEQKAIQRANLAKYLPQAAQKSASLRRGKRGPNARLSEQTVRDIFFSPISLNKTAKAYNVSKKMVLLVKQRKAHVYLTKGL